MAHDSTGKILDTTRLTQTTKYVIRNTNTLTLGYLLDQFLNELKISSFSAVRSLL